MLVRHAESLPDYAVPADRWTLSETGRAQARRLADARFWPDVRTLYSSDEPKALETAEPAARRHRLTLHATPDLREVRRPAGRLPDWEAVVRDYLAGAREPDGWEPRPDAERRAAAAFDRLLREHPNGDVVVVSHGTLLALYLGGLLGLPDPFALWSAIPFAGWARLDPLEPRLTAGFVASPP